MRNFVDSYNNRRTSHSLDTVRDFVIGLKRAAGEEAFDINRKVSFQWWWAFTKKYNIISLFYDQEEGTKCHSQT